MHRTGVDRALGNVRRSFWRFVQVLLVQVLCGVGFELRKTASRAEIISSALMQMTMLRGMRIDQHPADGVTHALRDLAIVLLAIVLPRMVVTRMAMIMVML